MVEELAAGDDLGPGCAHSDVRNDLPGERRCIARGTRVERGDPQWPQLFQCRDLLTQCRGDLCEVADLG